MLALRGPIAHLRGVTDRKNTGHPSEELLYDYLETSLTKEQNRAIEAHLADCRRCAEKLETMQLLLAVIGEWPATARRRPRRAAPALKTHHKSAV